MNIIQNAVFSKSYTKLLCFLIALYSFCILSPDSLYILRPYIVPEEPNGTYPFV